jgi:hypothetical protein
MPIVTHTLQTSTQADGRVHYILRMYDQDGTERLQTGLVPAGFDLTAMVNMRIVEADEQLAQDEFNALVGVG